MANRYKRHKHNEQSEHVGCASEQIHKVCTVKESQSREVLNLALSSVHKVGKRFRAFLVKLRVQRVRDVSRIAWRWLRMSWLSRRSQLRLIYWICYGSFFLLIQTDFAPKTLPHEFRCVDLKNGAPCAIHVMHSIEQRIQL